MEIFYDQYSKFGFVNIFFFFDVKEIVICFCWWQLRYDGLDQNDWVIDNVFILGFVD